MFRGVARIFRGGFVSKKNCKYGAKRGRFWLPPLLTSRTTLLDRADSLSGCSRAISLSLKAISSSSSWSSLLLPRQAPLVSVSGQRRTTWSRLLHCLLASSSSTTVSAAFSEETPVRGRHELEDPVEKNLYWQACRRVQVMSTSGRFNTLWRCHTSWSLAKKGVHSNPRTSPGYTLGVL